MKKCREYIVYYKHGFIESHVNNTLAMCLSSQEVLLNETIKPSRLQEYTIKIHSGEKDKDLSYFLTLKETFIKQATLAKLFCTATAQGSDDLLASYNISLAIAKLEKQLEKNSSY